MDKDPRGRKPRRESKQHKLPVPANGGLYRLAVANEKTGEVFATGRLVESLEDGEAAIRAIEQMGMSAVLLAPNDPSNRPDI